MFVYISPAIRVSDRTASKCLEKAVNESFVYWADRPCLHGEGLYSSAADRPPCRQWTPPVCPMLPL